METGWQRWVLIEESFPISTCFCQDVEKYNWIGCLKDYWNINWMSGMFDYDTKLIPPDPDFFSAGISIDSDDKWDWSRPECYVDLQRTAQVHHQGERGDFHRSSEVKHRLADPAEDSLRHDQTWQGWNCETDEQERLRGLLPPSRGTIRQRRTSGGEKWPQGGSGGSEAVWS